MTTRPKYIAVVNFSCSGNHYAPGDAVDNPIVLDAVLRFGDDFVSTETVRARTSRASISDAEPPASGNNTQSPEEASK